MFDEEFFTLGYLDTLSCKDTFVHRLDPRAKLLFTTAFIMTVVSFPKYEIAGLLPFFIFPALLFAFGDLPLKFILKKVLLGSAFVFFVGIFNPLIDRQAVCTVGGLPISGGWLSFFSIMLKFLLTITAALLLIATTSFPGICQALRKLGMPQVFVAQLLFLYRYIFVLTEETMRMVRARDMRSFGSRGRGMVPFVSLAGALFLRSVEKAERIYQAMLSRGFNGRLYSSRPFRFSAADAAFIIITVLTLYLLRTHDVAGIIGRLSLGAFKQ